MDSLQQQKERLAAQQNAAEEEKQKAREKTESQIKKALQEIRGCIQKLNGYSQTGSVGWHVKQKGRMVKDTIERVYLCFGKESPEAFYSVYGEKRCPSLAWLLENGGFTESAWDIIVADLKYEHDLLENASISGWYPALESDRELADELTQAAIDANTMLKNIEEKAEKARNIRGIIITAVIVAVLGIAIRSCLG